MILSNLTMKILERGFDAVIVKHIQHFTSVYSFMTLSKYWWVTGRNYSRCESSLYYVRKFFGKTNVSYTLIRTHTYTYQGAKI